MCQKNKFNFSKYLASLDKKKWLIIYAGGLGIIACTSFFKVVGEHRPIRNFITNILSMIVVTVCAQADGQELQNKQFIL